MKVIVSIIFLIAALAVDATPHNPVGITGGTNANFGEFPFIVSLQTEGCHRANASATIHTCSGTIISPNYILTAAHCVNKQNGSMKVLKIVAGLVDIEGGDETYRQDVGIESIVIHPDYETTYEQFGYMAPSDLAIVKLNQSLTFNEVVGSISLPEEDAQLDDNVDVQFVGWGDHVCWAEKPTRLQTTKYNIINYETCYLACLALFYDNDKLVTVDEDLSLCTGPLNNGTRVNVAGDSGGPLIKDGLVYGLHSWIFVYYNAAIDHDMKGPSGIFVKLSSYISWIKENVDDL